MKIVRTLVIVLVISLAISVSHFITENQNESDQPQQLWYAVWERGPATIEEATAYSSIIVTAEVKKVVQAPDIVTVLPNHPRGEDREPNQRVHLQVTEILGQPNLASGRSDIEVGSTVRVYHIGDSTQWIYDDPPYQIGEKYVLFLYEKIDEEGTHLVISPEGRYLVDDGILHTVADRKNSHWAIQLNGKGVSAIRDALPSRN